MVIKKYGKIKNLLFIEVSSTLMREMSNKY